MRTFLLIIRISARIVFTPKIENLLCGYEIKLGKPTENQRSSHRKTIMKVLSNITIKKCDIT